MHPSRSPGRLRVVRLEDRLAPAADITPIEQYALELVNRDRAGPATAAARYGIDLNEGLAAGTITAAAKEPLVPDQALLTAVRGHLGWLAANDLFQHQGQGGSMPWDRAAAAGFAGGVGENLFVRWPATTATEGFADASQQALFVDAGVAGRGHRTNLMNPNWRSAGVAFTSSAGKTYHGQNFGDRTDNALFLTGVVYGDANGNLFYNIAEAQTGVTVRAVNTATGAVVEEVVSPAGSYALRLVPGTYRVEVSGPAVGGQTRVCSQTIQITSRSVKLDYLSNRTEFKLGNSLVGSQTGSQPPGPGVGTPPAGSGGAAVGTDTSVGRMSSLLGGGPSARPVVVGDGASGRVRTFGPDGSERAAVDAFPGWTGGVRVASADFNGDGVADVVAGTGPGGPTRVRVLDGRTMGELFAIDPFEATFTGGVYVAAGDVTGDGVPDLIVTPDEGGGPRVRVFDGATFEVAADFLGIDDPTFRGGARAAVGDLNGDGVADLVVAAGFGGGPRVAGFDGATLTRPDRRKLFADFLSFEDGLRNGVYVAAGDLDGDGRDELIAAGGPGGGPRVLVFDGRALSAGNRPGPRADFFAGDPANRGGVRVTAGDLDGDGRADLLTGAGPGGGTRVTGYAGADVSGDRPPELVAFDVPSPSAAGVFVG